MRYVFVLLIPSPNKTIYRLNYKATRGHKLKPFILLFTVLIFLNTNSIAATQPFAKGEYGALKWEALFTHLSVPSQPSEPVCSYPNHSNAWCKRSNKAEASKKAGIDERLKELVFNPYYKSISMAYFSFSNSKLINDVLCKAAQQRKGDLKINLFIDSREYVETTTIIDEKTVKVRHLKPGSNVDRLNKCSEHITVVGRGKGPFGSSGAHLLHIKVILASPLKVNKPLHMLSDASNSDLFTEGSQPRVFFTSSSANMSGSGTSLHFENWLMFDDQIGSHLAQSQFCLFFGLQNATGKKPRISFAKNYKSCVQKIKATPQMGLQFFAVPHVNKIPKPYPALRSLLESAHSEVLVAIHRLTTGKMTLPLLVAANNGAQVKIIYDDDTLWAGKYGGPKIVRASHPDVKQHRALRASENVETLYMETNNNIGQLHHNKFIVIDNHTLFQGAGNFTATALNAGVKGNYEQFYIITVPEIVNAYRQAWRRLSEFALTYKEHPGSQLKDRYKFKRP